MKHSKALKRMGLVWLVALALLLSGCYANTPTIEGTTGDMYPEYPTQNVNVTTPNPLGNTQTQTNVPVNVTTSQPVATSTVNVINQQTPVVLATQNPGTGTATGNSTTIPVVVTTDAPTATPSNILKLGATGAAVRDLQQKLKALGYLNGSVDGDFGEATEAAVKAFQKQAGIEVDGIAGIETLRKLASSSMTAKPTASPTPKPTAKPEYGENTYLKVGSSGSLVTKMQDRLIQLGYLDGKATGRFDEATEAAVIAFQKRNTSYWDGVAGKLTLDALFSSSARSTSTSAGIIGESLKLGSEGSAVRTLQTRLKALGYYTGSIDGDFGESTEAAVKAFQKANGLTADGKVGSETMARMNSDSAIKAGSNVLEIGSQGNEVVTLQNRLKALGYYSGNVDGDFGESTRSAVIAFQKRNGLTTDGRVGAATEDVLYSSSAIKAQDTSSNGSNVLQVGSKGELVVKLQSRLKVLGYYTGNVDGDFGTSTETALKAYQRQNGLTVDGKAGEETQNKIFGTSNATAKPSATATAVPENVYVAVTPHPDGNYVTLQRGHYGLLVRTMQEALKAQGYFNGSTDGYFGEATEVAVKNFQKNEGLSQTGIATPTTLRVLYEGDFPEGS